MRRDRKILWRETEDRRRARGHAVSAGIADWATHDHNAVMTQYELEGLWVENALNVVFHFGDIVRITSGEDAGIEGRIVALFTLEPFPTYVIELADGSSAVATEPNLALVNVK